MKEEIKEESKYFWTNQEFKQILGSYFKKRPIEDLEKITPILQSLQQEEITESQVNLILGYLSWRPYVEVVAIFNSIKDSIKLVGSEEAVEVSEEITEEVVETKSEEDSK